MATTLDNFANVDVHKSNIGIIWTPIFEWYVIRCGFEIDTTKTCVSESGLRAQNMLPILDWIVSMIGGTYMTP